MIGTVTKFIQIQGVDLILCHKTEGGLEGFGHSVAGVKDSVAQGNVGKQSTAVVNFLNCKNHCLEPTESTEIVPARAKMTQIQLELIALDYTVYDHLIPYLTFTSYMMGIDNMSFQLVKTIQNYFSHFGNLRAPTSKYQQQDVQLGSNEFNCVTTSKWLFRPNKSFHPIDHSYMT